MALDLSMLIKHCSHSTLDKFVSLDPISILLTSFPVFPQEQQCQNTVILFSFSLGLGITYSS